MVPLITYDTPLVEAFSSLTITGPDTEGAKMQVPEQQSHIIIEAFIAQHIPEKKDAGNFLNRDKTNEETKEEPGEIYYPLLAMWPIEVDETETIQKPKKDKSAELKKKKHKEPKKEKPIKKADKKKQKH